MKSFFTITLFLLISNFTMGQLTDSVSVDFPDCQHYFDKKQNRNIYDYADEKAKFPLGDHALLDFIKRNLKYPESGIDAEGTVFIQFIVETNGKITNKSVKKSVHPELEKEAMKMIDKMPDWIPAQCEGELVPFLVTIPIKFKLQ